MDSAIVKELLPPLAIAAWSGAVMLAAWWRAAPRWAAALALGGGMAIASALDVGFRQFLTWGEPRALVAHAAVAAMILALVLDLPWLRRTPALVWGSRAAAVLFLALAIVARWADREQGLAAYTQHAGALALLVVLALAAWHSAEALAARAAPGRGVAPLLPLLVGVGLSVPLLFAATIAVGKSTSWVFAWLVVCTIVAGTLGRRRAVSLAGPGVSVLVLTLAASLFARAHGYDQPPAWQAACVALSPVAAWLASLGPLRALSGWKRAAVEIVLGAIPVLIALAVAIPQALREAGDAI